GTSAGTERRTPGSGATSGSRSIASDGWFARISRGLGQCGASRSHSASTASRSPTTEDERRPAWRASSANAVTAASARDASRVRGTTGTRFAPAQHTASSGPTAGKPHAWPPAACRPARWATTSRAAASVDATGSPAHTASASGTSASRRTRARASGPVRARARNAGTDGRQRATGTSADRDDRGSGLGVVLRRHGLRDAQRLLDERLDDQRLGHRLDDLALDEDLALAVARRDAEVGLARLARAVADAAHDGDAQRHLHALQAGGDLLRERVDVHLGAAARGARDDLELAGAQVERLEDLVADLDLLDRRGREGDADRVADALAQQRAERRRGLDRALERRACLGHAEVQRPVARLGEQLVRAHHDDRVVVLDGDLEVVEVVLLEERRLPHGRL